MNESKPPFVVTNPFMHLDKYGPMEYVMTPMGDNIERGMMGREGLMSQNNALRTANGNLKKRIEKLEAAIREHRQGQARHGDNHIDRTLWQTLEGE